ncbi:IS3 family transposase [Leptospira santarosai]|uniref:IS3 family transposase n=1 Tax=Leptospira santarosai TaxID=28183 RepID=UPI001F207162|nr:IS3 family transposase [Leptospira santarosai]MDI7230615.1 IS3 family transposase [Leptospira santarosai]
MSSVCRYFEKSRQAYYQRFIPKSKKELISEEELLVNEVKRIRHLLPATGGRKLYEMLKPVLHEYCIKMGRDKLFHILKRNGLLLEKPRKHSRTTNSNHSFFKHPNLIQNLIPAEANLIFVSDITYIRVEDGFAYLSLVTDLYSKKIVGFNLHSSLETEGCIYALRMALAQLPKNKKVIHHSDRGIQFCSKDYTDILINSGHKISMTEVNHCYENAVAERINKTLKFEFGLRYTFDSFKEAQSTIQQAVFLYNNVRLHQHLGFFTPEFVHQAS